MKIDVPLKPFTTPNFVLADNRPDGVGSEYPIDTDSATNDWRDFISNKRKEAVKIELMLAAICYTHSILGVREISSVIQKVSEGKCYIEPSMVSAYMSPFFKKKNIINLFFFQSRIDDKRVYSVSKYAVIAGPEILFQYRKIKLSTEDELLKCLRPLEDLLTNKGELDGFEDFVKKQFQEMGGKLSDEYEAKYEAMEPEELIKEEGKALEGLERREAIPGNVLHQPVQGLEFHVNFNGVYNISGTIKLLT